MPNSQLTRLREVSNTLDHNHSQISGFFEMSPDLFGILRSDGYLDKINRSWRISLGWNDSELSDRPLIHFVHNGDVDTFQEFLVKLEDNETSFCQCRLQCKDGGFVKVEFSASGWSQNRSNIVGRISKSSYLRNSQNFNSTDKGDIHANHNKNNDR